MKKLTLGAIVISALWLASCSSPQAANQKGRKEMVTRKTLFALTSLLFLASSLLLLPVGSAQAQSSTGTVTGQVVLDGQPLAGVEVFLGVGTDPFDARYVCTDENGYFSFSDVPFEVGLISAVGIEVAPWVPCDNPHYLDYGYHPKQPILVQFYQAPAGIRELNWFSLTDEEPSIYIDYSVEVWPTTDFPPLTNFIRQSVQHHHNAVSKCRFALLNQAYLTLDQFDERVDSLQESGDVTPGLADDLRSYSDTLRTIYGLSEIGDPWCGN